MTDVQAAPPGTATFLFSDIEGSTRLEERIGTTRYGVLRERQRELMRAAITQAGGDEQGTEGDSFFVLFAGARAALAAAVAAQRSLAAEPWPDDAPVRVRMGMHTGEPATAGGSLVGLDINRAARIAAAAHGGQILVSDATRALVASTLPPGVTLRDLGEFRLRDLSAPERLVQVDIDGLQSAFPPPTTLEVRPSNLPTQLTTFIGRAEELAAARELLETTRLLTLTGPGGTGKTRLSLELAASIAERFPGGVFFVPLEPIRDPMLVAPRIAMAVGLIESGNRPIAEILGEWLAARRVLLVLDNVEQVIEAAPIVGELIKGAPELSIIATSRAALRISGEQEYPVPGLPVPPDPGQLSGIERMQLPGAVRDLDADAIGTYPAVRLFIDRARAVRPAFSVTNENAPAVAAIAARLHGMPLAIELAAARVKLLSPDAILSRLEHQLDVLAAGGRDLSARQQTLRGAIAWSFDLLDDGARRLLARSSVFAGAFDVASVEVVCGPAGEVGGDVTEGMLALADQSLARVEESADGEPLFRLLVTIREFAAERLADAGETAEVERRHTAHYRAIAEEAAAHLSGEDQRRWLDRLEWQHDDIRAVLDRAVAVPDPDTAIGTAFALWRFWQKHGHLGEARRRLEAMAGAPWSRTDPRLRAKLMEALGGACWWQGDVPEMTVHYQEALDLWLAIGDEREIANAYYNASFSSALPPPGDATPEVTALDLKGLGYLEEAQRRFHGLGDALGEANALWGLGNRHYFRGAPGNGAPEVRAALALFQSLGDRTMEAWSEHMLGTALLRNGDVEESRVQVAHAIRHFHAAGDAAGLTLTLDDMSAIAVADGDLPRAARLRGAARVLTRETGAGLASFVEDTFELTARQSVRTVMSPEDIARYGAEGAAMTLDEAIDYALVGSPPESEHHGTAG